MKKVPSLPPEWRKIENVKIVVPILAIIFAIIFDLGFFESIGLAWFSFFTLSEHLIIAVESAPLVVVTLALLFLNLAIIYNLEKLLRSGAGVSIPYILAVSIFLLGSIAYSVYASNYLGLAVSVFTTLFIGVIALGSNVLISVFAIFTSVVFIFGIGLLAGYLYISAPSSPYTLYVKTGIALKGKLLVGGERGILFFDSNSKTSEFFKWDDVSKIERQKRSLQE